MSRLIRVTITGADNSTAISELLDLSAEFPFVEWGILVSERHEGSPRFPGREWIGKFSTVAQANNLNVSTHVCGKWARQMLTGILNWPDLPDCIQICQRVQINTHAEPHVSTTSFIASLFEQYSKQFIFQWDGVNDHLAFAAHAYELNVAALFDMSGGAGILPKEWPRAGDQFPYGYAGGIGPDNVVEQVRKIEQVCPRPFWIDMERRVRAPDDSALDMKAVRAVLKSTADLIKQDACVTSVLERVTRQAMRRAGS